MSAQAPGTGPYRYNALFEFGEDALFLEVAKGWVGFCAGGEFAIGSLRRGTCVDGVFGGYEIMRCQRYWRLRCGEEEPNLLRDEVSGKGRAGDTFFEDEAVMNRGYGDGGGANIDDKSGGFPRGEAIAVSFPELNRRACCPYATKTPFLASQYAGQPQFSMATSMPLSRSFPEFQPVSVMSSGFSPNGFS